MILKCLGSSSSGNCYLLCHNDEVLILDAGIPIKAIKRGLNWQLGGIQAVLCSHGHHDHDLSIRDFKNMGIEVFQPYLSENKTQFRKFGNFSVQSFEVPHDNEPCCAFYITVDGHRILYATDFEYLPCSFKNVRLTDMIVECNHQTELVDKGQAKYPHQIKGHCSLDTLIEKIIKENMTSDLRTIVLCHMSSDSVDCSFAKKQIEEVVSRNVKVELATTGLETELSLTPF